MNVVVRTLVDDDGEPIPKQEQKWCLSDPKPFKDANRKLCSGEYWIMTLRLSGTVKQ
ncbi:MAG: hypothetical protein HAW67_01540 [Endozoicomonadaceae bacterium]|nr:hypothetical protein [Endozoicomonadaceae bacterium]